MFKPGGRFADHQFAARVVAILLATLVLAIASTSTQAQRPNGAGLVVQHGDGTLIYVYVPFEEDSISGEELLTRSALAIEVDVFGGLGLAVCSLNGEGCPSDDCFCQSYSDPATFWHYYTWTESGWTENPFGASVRVLSDGDIDGWSWNAGSNSLPSVSIDEIATLNGFDRSPPQPTDTATAVPTLAPTATPVPTATAIPPTATPTLAPTLPAPTTSVQPVNTPSATATIGQTRTPTLAPTYTITSQGASIGSSTPAPATSTLISATTPADVSAAAPTGEPNESPGQTANRQQEMQAAAVIVTPGGTPQPLPASESSDTSAATTFILFAIVFGILAVAGLGLFYRSRVSSS